MASLAACYNEEAQLYPAEPFFDPGIQGSAQEQLYLYRYQQDYLRDSKLRKASSSDPSLSHYDPEYFPTMAAPATQRNGAYNYGPADGEDFSKYNSGYGEPYQYSHSSALFPHMDNTSSGSHQHADYTPPRYYEDVGGYVVNSGKRPRSKDRARRRLSFNDPAMPSWERDVGTISQPVYDKANDQWHPVYDTVEAYASPGSSAYYSGSRDDHTLSHSSNRSDYSHGRWQQWSWSPPNMYRSSAMSPSSPLDSGLSSQSVASSPSIENEETIHMGNHKNYDYERIPFHQRRRDTRQCNCPSNVYADYHRTHGHQWKTDSGRSSPWATPPIHQCILVPPQQLQMKHPRTIASHVDHEQYPYVEPTNSQQDRVYYLEAERQEYRVQDHQGHKESPHDLFDNLNEFQFVVSTPPAHTSCSSEDTSECTIQESQASQDTVTVSRTNNDTSNPPVEKQPVPHRPARLVKVSPLVDLSVVPPSPNGRSKQEKGECFKDAELAICELEEIYKQLNLDDFDLLDRAERRDLPTAHQNTQELPPLRNHVLTRSKSDSFYEMSGYGYDMCYPKAPRAPPMRRSGIPDRIADDMALRKQQKAASRTPKMVGNLSYMLSSAHFTPSILPGVNEFPLFNRPDVEYDDLSYRKYFQTKVERPQPPFGIPLKPVIQSSTDYLHATPSNVPQALCHPRGNPDVVRDDMAYRTLRRDVS